MPEENQVVTQSPGSLLADEMYAEPAEPAHVPTDDVPVDDVQATDDEPTEIVAEAEPTDDVEEVELQSVEQLAEHFEFDPEVIDNLTIKQKVNGQEIEVQLGEALATHRKVKAADTYLAEAKEKSKAMVQSASQDAEQAAAAVVSLGAMIKTVQDEIQSDVEGIDWNELRRSDPAEYSAKKEEVRERNKRIEQVQQEAAQALQQYQQLTSEQDAANRTARLPQEHEILLSKVPEWADDDKASAERSEVVEFLKSEGLPQETIEYLSYDGTALSLAVKAMRYDKSKEKSNATKKKVVKIPKVLKPGNKQGDANTAAPKSDDPADLLYG